MQKNSDNFTMFCIKCGKEHSVSPSDTNPTCECGGMLDFEPVEKVEK